MPKLWTDTIEAHRHAVQDAILETTARLAAEHGLRSVTMSQVALEAGIGRATLYKYFPDVESIVVAWHEVQIDRHLSHLTGARDRAGGAGQRLAAVLDAFAVISYETRRHHGTELGTFLHRDRQVARAQDRVHDMVVDLVADAARSGDVRTDVAPDELATFCLHALAAAGALSSRAALRRLVTVTLAGLQAAPGAAAEPPGRPAPTTPSGPRRRVSRHHPPDAH